eukprot:7205083-Prymnesium_polylepis.1
MMGRAASRNDPPPPLRRDGRAPAESLPRTSERNGPFLPRFTPGEHGDVPYGTQLFGRWPMLSPKAVS